MWKFSAQYVFDKCESKLIEWMLILSFCIFIPSINLDSIKCDISGLSCLQGVNCFLQSDVSQVRSRFSPLVASAILFLADLLFNRSCSNHSSCPLFHRCWCLKHSAVSLYLFNTQWPSSALVKVIDFDSTPPTIGLMDLLWLSNPGRFEPSCSFSANR
jgi:hypothetical protein